MMVGRHFAGMLSAMVLLTGCASGGGGGLSDPSEIRRDLGRATYLDARAGIEKVLVTKNSYVIQRFEENYNTVWFETEWQTTDAMATEQEQGIVQVRTQIVIDGRRSTNDTFRLRFTAVCESLQDGSREWVRLPVSDERRAEIRRMLADLDMELRSGVRTIG